MDKKVMNRTLTPALRGGTSLNTANRVVDTKAVVTTKECMVRVSPPPSPMRCESGSAGWKLCNGKWTSCKCTSICNPGSLRRGTRHCVTELTLWGMLSAWLVFKKGACNTHNQLFCLKETCKQAIGTATRCRIFSGDYVYILILEVPFQNVTSMLHHGVDAMGNISVTIATSVPWLRERNMAAMTDTRGRTWEQVSCDMHHERKPPIRYCHRVDRQDQHVPGSMGQQYC